MKVKMVKIFQKWMTEEEYEGEAELVRLEGKIDKAELWEVKFEGEEATFLRWIKKHDE